VTPFNRGNWATIISDETEPLPKWLKKFDDKCLLLMAVPFSEPDDPNELALFGNKEDSGFWKLRWWWSITKLAELQIKVPRSKAVNNLFRRDKENYIWEKKSGLSEAIKCIGSNKFIELFIELEIVRMDYSFAEANLFTILQLLRNYIDKKLTGNHQKLFELEMKIERWQKDLLSNYHPFKSFPPNSSFREELKKKLEDLYSHIRALRDEL